MIAIEEAFDELAGMGRDLVRGEDLGYGLWAEIRKAAGGVRLTVLQGGRPVEEVLPAETVSLEDALLQLEGAREAVRAARVRLGLLPAR